MRSPLIKDVDVFFITPFDKIILIRNPAGLILCAPCNCFYKQTVLIFLMNLVNCLACRESPAVTQCLLDLCGSRVDLWPGYIERANRFHYHKSTRELHRREQKLKLSKVRRFLLQSLNFHGLKKRSLFSPCKPF